MKRTSVTPAPRASFRSPESGCTHPSTRCVSGVAPRVAPRAGGLIGRERELASVGAAFATGAHLVTLHGPAGIGKTSLAREVVRSCDAAFAPAHRVFCDLTEVRDAGSLGHALARALEVAVTAGSDDAMDAIGRALAARGPLLLVLDNFEQLVELAPASVARWLALAPEARLLVTSRERLRVAGERCVELEPLGMPPADEHDPDAIAAADAVRLFVERARALDGGFALRAVDAPEVAAIVRAVDGIPLAIELCAARSAVLAPAQLRRELARRFELLVHGPRGAAARHATLRAAIDWSWHLLAPWERDALACCAVFRGGFTLDAAARVLDPARWSSGGGAGAAPTVLDALQALADKSLLRVESAPAGQPSARRFALYESVREYAAECLARDGDAAEAAIARHADHYLAEGVDLAARATTGPDAGAALARLSLEVENLRAVYDRAMSARPLTPARALAALGALVALDPVTLARNPLGPYARMLDEALAAAPADTPPAARARGLMCGAKAAWLAGRLPRSMALFAQAADAADAAGDDAQAGMALAFLGCLHHEQGDAARCHALFAQSDARLARLGDPWLRANRDLLLAMVLSGEPRLDEAASLAADALAQFERAGTERLAALARSHLGSIALEAGRFDESCARLADAMARARAAGDVGLEATAQGYHARALHAQGRFDDAAEGFARARALHERVGQSRLAGLLHGYTAGLLLEREWVVEPAAGGCSADARAARLARAEEHAARAVAALEAAGDARHAAVFAALHAAVDAARGLLADAAARIEAAARAVPPGALHAGVSVALFRGHIDCARARRARAEGDARAAARHLANARLALAGDGSVAGAGACSELVRLARRLLAHAVAEASAGAPPDPSPSRGDGDARAADAPPVGSPVNAVRVRTAPSAAARDEARAALAVGPEARWFRTPAGGRVDLLRRRAPRLILLRLVEARLATPGRALSLAELFDAGWPGERARADSAANRVYVALTRLRQLGLRDLLQSRDDGFLLDPEAAVLRDAAPHQRGHAA